MKMNGKKLTALLGTAVLAMGILAGCGSSTTETTAAGTAAPATTAETAAEASATAGETKDQAATEAENAQSADLSGAISMVGSTSMEKFANALSEYSFTRILCCPYSWELSLSSVNPELCRPCASGRYAPPSGLIWGLRKHGIYHYRAGCGSPPRSRQS